jgi:hypothetical protein
MARCSLPSNLLGLFLFTPALLLGGCPTGTPEGDDAGSAITDAGFVGDDAGAGVDAGPAPDSGTPPADAGPLADAGENAADGGTGSCGPVDPCDGVVADGTALTFNGGAAPTVNVGANVFTIGVDTRAAVEAVLGTGVASTTTAYRVYYCDKGLVFSYVDDQSAGVMDGTANGADGLARVSATSNANASTSEGAAIGDLRTDALADMGAETSSSYTVPGDSGGQADFFYNVGLSFLSLNGTVAGITAARPLGADHFGLVLDLAGSKLGAGGTEVVADFPLLRAGTAFSALDAKLGTAFDVEGDLTSGGNTYFLRIYAAAGIRFAGLCDGTDCSGANIQSIVLSSPFLGKDSNGIGLGSTRAEVEALYTVDSVQTDATSGAEMTVYEGDGLVVGNLKFGVIYAENSSCVERVAALVLNYIDI